MHVRRYIPRDRWIRRIFCLRFGRSSVRSPAASNDAPRDRIFVARVVDGALGGCVAGSLFYKLDLGLPFYFGSLLSAVVGGIIVVIVFDRLRTS